ncbi:sigma factor [Streptomyces sp. NPDC059629]|uniref:sigma factor n=1 Tax=Streptomyces sp. NPDC059629 TaxID=3346889 RepID=UPI003696AFD3
MTILWSRAQRATSHETLIRVLYLEHGNALLAYATRLTGDRTTAESVVQETLVRAWRHPEIITDPEGSLRGRLLMLARGVVTDRDEEKPAQPDKAALDDRSRLSLRASAALSKRT